MSETTARQSAGLSLVAQRALMSAKNVFASVSSYSREAVGLVNWIFDFRDAMDLDIEKLDELDERAHRYRRTDKRQWVESATWESIETGLGGRQKAGVWPTELLDARLAELSTELGLSPLEAAIVQFFCDYRRHKIMEDLLDHLSASNGEERVPHNDCRRISMILSADEAKVRECMRHDAPLRASGLLYVDSNNCILPMRRLQYFLNEPAGDFTNIRSYLFGSVQTASLTMQDFAHLGEDLQQVRSILKGALSEKASGVLVILYGPPGTGKTELAKTLAESLGAPLYSIGETDSEGNEPTRSERLAELCLAQKLGLNADTALFLLDEAEDLFGQDIDFFGMVSRRAQNGSRNFLHRTLEKGPKPVIMTANSLSAFGEAVLRRATCCIEVKVPPPSVRAEIWKAAAVQMNVALPETEIARMGRHLPASPALAKSAMRAAHFAGGDSKTALWAISGVLKAMKHGVDSDMNAPAEIYDPNLIAADVDLARITESLTTRGKSKSFSLLLHGVSGSGKSAYARHLAERMGLCVLQKRASDLLGMYVGQTEKAIAEAFTEAADTEAFLLFDEIDSLLADRRSANRTWEVSQVNELLTWMEPARLKVPFCATTNLVENLDTASLRRFTFKVGFSWLRQDQVELAFKQILGCEPPRSVGHLISLCPADFTLVRDAAEFQGVLDDPEALLVALEREQRSKPGISRPVGFTMLN
jgi:transitional endoplasmic reticulum ATPase